jgi:hypothetical protein
VAVTVARRRSSGTTRDAECRNCDNAHAAPRRAHARLGLRVVAGDEHVKRAALGQPGGAGVEGVGDVDDDLARQRVTVLGDELRGTGAGQREDDDVAGRRGAGFPRRGAVPERVGQAGGLS